jgi:hypothetical protein
MRSVLLTNRIFPRDAATLQAQTDGLLNPEQFRRDYENGDRVADSTLASALRGLKMLDDPIDYFAIGSVTVDRGYTNPVSGRPNVAVIVTSRVIHVDSSTDIASSEPKIYVGEGNTMEVAKTNAIKSAARESARIIAGQITQFESY